jgi:tetratricopeptide (TPR) repeat protein
LEKNEDAARITQLLPFVLFEPRPFFRNGQQITRQAAACRTIQKAKISCERAAQTVESRGLGFPAAKGVILMFSKWNAYRITAWPTTLAQLASACLFLMIPASNSLCQESHAVKKILELHPIDHVTIDLNTIEKECSQLLAHREKHDAGTLEKALRARALVYLRMKKYIAARKDFDDLCMLLPNNPELRCHRCFALLGLKQQDQADNDAEAALRLNPSFPMAYVAAAACVLDRGTEKKHVVLAVDLLNKAIALAPNCAKAHYMKGVIFLDIDPGKCLDAMNRYIELDPCGPFDTPEYAHYCRGIALSRLNRVQEALSSLLLARKLNPNSLDVATELALSYAALGRFHLAAHYAEEAVRIKPEDAYGYGIAAEYYGCLGDSKAFAEASVKAITLAKKEPEVYFIVDAHSRVGNGFFALGKYAEALEHYKAAYGVDPNNKFNLQFMASFLATCPDPTFRDGPKAVKLARMVYEAKSLREYQKWRPGMVLAEALAETGDFEGAVRHAKDALEIAGPDFGRRDEFREKLASFEKKMPWRAKIKTTSPGE